MSNIHYEIFIQKKKAKDWTLHEAVDGREKALKKAGQLVKQSTVAGVRVMKETLEPDTGNYLSVAIFQEGGSTETKRDKDDVQLPCFKPQDLFSIHARATITRVLEDLLDREGMTAKELIHRADMLESLQATGTVMQHAIQKIAVAQSTSDNVPVAEVMKQLTVLIDQAMERVFVDERDDAFVKLTQENFHEVLTQVADKSDSEYYFSAAIAKAFSSMESWTDKVQFLVALLRNLPTEEDPRAIALISIDDFVSEIMAGSAGLDDLMGNQEQLGDALMIMADLFLGRIDEKKAGATPGLVALSSQFAEDKLPNSKTALGQRILSELNGPRRFCTNDVDKEVEAGRTLAMRMVLCQGKHVALEDILEAFTNRSKRLVITEMVNEYLEGYDEPDQQIQRLMKLEENVIGEENKRRLGGFVMPLLTGHKTEAFFVEQEGPVLRRLTEITKLQKEVTDSSFADNQKQEMQDAIDTIAGQVVTKAKLFEAIDGRKVSNADKAMSFLRILNSNVLTEGELSRKARVQIIKYIQTPNFSKDLMQVDPSKVPDGSDKSQAVMSEFKSLMQETGTGEMLNRNTSAA